MNKQILKGWTKTHLQWIGIVAMVCAGFLTSCVQSRTPQTLDRFTNAQQGGSPVAFSYGRENWL